MPAMEDRATLRSDPSASWLPKGRCHTVSLFSVACLRAKAIPVVEPLRNKAINLEVQGAEPLLTVMGISYSFLLQTGTL